GADRRRADARDRHRNEGGGAPASRRTRGRRSRDPDDLVRAAGGSARRRPHPRHARGAARRGARPLRGVRGENRRRGDRSAPGGGRLMASAEHAETRVPLAKVSSRRLIDLVYRLRAFGILLALVVLILVTTAIQPRFFSGNELNIVLGNTSILALLALGEAVVVISRNVDLSVGSVLGLSP